MIEFQALASGSSGNLYTLTDGQSTLLLECGLPYKEIQRVTGFRVSEMDGCLLTHTHKDHSKSVVDVMKAGVGIYTSQGTIDALGLTGHRIHAVKAGKQFRIGAWHIMPLEAQHDAPEPLAYLIANSCGEKCLFATDTYYLKNRFVGLNIIAVECNYAEDILDANVEAGLVPAAMRDRLLRSHFSLENVKEFLRANDLSRVEEIWLLHLSSQNSCKEQFKQEIQALTGKPTYIA